MQNSSYFSKIRLQKCILHSLSRSKVWTVLSLRGYFLNLSHSASMQVHHYWHLINKRIGLSFDKYSCCVNVFFHNFRQSILIGFIWCMGPQQRLDLNTIQYNTIRYDVFFRQSTSSTVVISFSVIHSFILRLVIWSEKTFSRLFYYYLLVPFPHSSSLKKKHNHRDENTFNWFSSFARLFYVY